MSRRSRPHLERGCRQCEIRTQKRVLSFLPEAPGYAYVGYGKDREGNANVEEALLTDWLSRQGHGDKIIAKTLHELGQAAVLGVLEFNRSPLAHEEWTH